MRTPFGRHCRYVNIRALNREDSVLYFPPEAFGPFRVLHQIGAGARGPVFRAHDPGRDRLLAIKVFRLDLTPEQAEALVHELEQLVGKGLSHPSIAAPIAAGLENGTVYLAEEYAIGDSLDVVLREGGPLQGAAAVDLIETFAEAIDYAADRGVHHGSLHPRDIIVSSDGARITGFGIAGALSRLDPQFDTQGTLFPTRAPYAALEKPSDVYSLAAIAFEVISGRRYSAANLDELGGEHGPDLRRAFSSALAGGPELRPVRAGEFASAFAAAAALRDAGPSAGKPLAPIAPDKSDAPDLDLRLDSQDAAQPPNMLQSAELASETASGAGLSRIVLVVLIGAVAAALAVGYRVVKTRSASQATGTAESKPSVETTVDLPAAAPTAPAPSPQTGALPAPAPSRPASGAPPRTAPRSRTVATRGNLLIRSTPPNADVVVNGQSRGKTPTTIRDLPLGSYTIRVARDGYAPEQQSVQLTATQSTAAMAFELRSQSGVGGVNVESRPTGARVFVNDKLIGITPLAISDLPAGPATVRIEMDGYQTWVTTVSVNAGVQTRVGASLDRR